MLCVSSEVTFRKNFDGSRTQGLGPPSNSISFEEPRVTKATEEGSTACGRKREKRPFLRAFLYAGGLTLPPAEVTRAPLLLWELGVLICHIPRGASTRVLCGEFCPPLIYCWGDGNKLACLFCKTIQ